MTTILQHSKNVLHKCDEYDKNKRVACEDMLRDVCVNIYDLSPYSELAKAYKTLEQECAAHYTKSLKSIRKDTKFPPEQSQLRTNTEKCK